MVLLKMRCSCHPSFRACVALLLVSLLAGSRLAGSLKWSDPVQEIRGDPGKAEVSTTFQFVNEGSTPVGIIELTTSCGCTVATLEHDSYAPGEKGSIAVTIHYGSETSTMERTVSVSTDDRATPQDLVVKVTVPGPRHPIARIQSTPESLTWNADQDKEPQRIRLYVSQSNDAIRPTGAICDDPNFHVEMHRPDPADDRLYELIVSPTDVDRPRQAVLRILTNSKTFRPAGMPEVEFKVDLTIK